MVVWVEILEAKYGQVVMYFMVLPVELRRSQHFKLLEGDPYKRYRQ